MRHPEPWNPLVDWKPAKIEWIRVNISRDDLLKFTRRSNFKGLIQAVGFLAIVAMTGAWAWWSFSRQYWLMLALALYVHGIVYSHFGDALHELSHNTVFSSRALSTFFTTLYGLLYWPWNPHLYRISHKGYHHMYTLHQGSDGEEVPQYVGLSPKQLLILFFNVFQIKALIQNLGRLFTLKPTSKHWRGFGYKLDHWEQFILKNASEKDRKLVHRFSLYSLISQVIFVGLCIYFGLWFLPVLITLAPFYSALFHSYFCGMHQHAAREPNNPDFRASCASVKLDPVSSFLYWRMEYHTEHHMFAAIPCYNLKKFRRFIEDQMPPRRAALPRLLHLHKQCRDKYGNWQRWRDTVGFYKGI